MRINVLCADDSMRQGEKNKQKKKKKLSSRQYAQLANQLMERRRFKEARECYYKALESRRPSSMWFLALTICETALKNAEAAKKVLVRLTRRTIRHGKLEEHSTRVESYLRDYPRLREVFYDVILEEEREQALPYVGLARACAMQQKWDKALSVLLEAIGVGNLSGVILPEIKGVLRANGNKEGLKQVRCYEQGKIKSVELAQRLLPGKGPGDKSVKSRSAASESLGAMIGELEEELGVRNRPPESDKEIYAGIQLFLAKIEPIIVTHPKTRMDLALGFYVMGLVEVAQEELRRIPTTADCFLEARCLLGEIFFRQGADPLALGVYSRVLRDERASQSVVCEAKYKLIEIYTRLGDVRRARHLARELKQENPDYREIRSMWNALKREQRTGT